MWSLSKQEKRSCSHGQAAMHLRLALASEYQKDSPRPACYASSPSTADNFDRLPDSLLETIFSKIADIRTLGRCCAVSKRFSLLAPQTDNVVVKVDCVISAEESNLNVKQRGILMHLFWMFCAIIFKPFQILQNLLSSKKEPVDVSHHSPVEVLNNFRAIQNLRIELPGGELGTEEGVLLKWKADFGSTLENCVILGASSLVKHESEQSSFSDRKGGHPEGKLDNEMEVREVAEVASVDSQNDNSCIPESFYTDGSLKLRVFWTISSLIAASARHYLLQRIIADHPTLENLVLTDADGQGTLCMEAAQLQRFREEPLTASASANRTEVPDLNMRLWYAPYLDLPGGIRLKGATLVAIKRQGSSGPDRGEFFTSAFEEPYRTAASILIRRRTYVLEMNSF
ncbi:hypothetical protein O6H91_09G034900 [Diphasiastrum complanatum]|uniref:Uncharacterized protein n=1 Tax=Diphasiastrum complanatum TaxID=34168 RepID=A0ACC2CN31_DIPCM|nr:hypothetical protein O6H91_Y499800 [Diphasiastrum complanatum]KAJ7543376.1 hypothetical protein O6H91_09G034900 [Diphasiastrum complanatum]